MTYSLMHKQLRVVKRRHQNKSKRTSTRTSQLIGGVSVSTNVTTSYWDDDDNDNDHDGGNNSVVELQMNDERVDDSRNRRCRKYNRRNFKTSNMLMKDVREIFKQHDSYPQQSHDNYPQQSSSTSNSIKPGKAKRQLLTTQLATDSLIKETMRLVKDLKLVSSSKTK
jgi:hypothetical protein